MSSPVPTDPDFLNAFDLIKPIRYVEKDTFLASEIEFFPGDTIGDKDPNPDHVDPDQGEPIEPSPPPITDPVEDAENIMFSKEVINTILFFMIALACLAIICVYLAQAAGYFGTVEGKKGLWKAQYEEVKKDLGLCTATQSRIDELTNDLNRQKTEIEAIALDLESLAADRDRWISQYDEMQQSRDEWIQNYQDMEEDRDKWLVRYDEMKLDRDKWSSEYGLMQIDRDEWKEKYVQLLENTTARINELTADLEETTATLQTVRTNLETMRNERDTWRKRFEELDPIVLSSDNAKELWYTTSWGRGTLSLPQISNEKNNTLTGTDHLKIEISNDGEAAGVAMVRTFDPVTITPHNLLSIEILGGHPDGVSILLTAPGQPAMSYELPRRVHWQRYYIPIKDFEPIGTDEKPTQIGRLEISFTNPGTYHIDKIVLYR